MFSIIPFACKIFDKDFYQLSLRGEGVGEGKEGEGPQSPSGELEERKFFVSQVNFPFFAS